MSVDAEGILSAVGLVVAFLIARVRARRVGIDFKQLNSFSAWLLAGLIIGGHVADVLCYHFEEIVDFSSRQVFWNHLWKLL